MLHEYYDTIRESKSRKRSRVGAGFHGKRVFRYQQYYRSLQKKEEDELLEIVQSCLNISIDECRDRVAKDSKVCDCELCKILEAEIPL